MRLAARRIIDAWGVVVMMKEHDSSNRRYPRTGSEIAAACIVFTFGLALPAIIPAVLVGVMIVFMCYKQDPKPKTERTHYGWAIVIGFGAVTIIKGVAQPDLVLTSLGAGGCVGIVLRHLWVGDSNKEIKAAEGQDSVTPIADKKAPEQPQTIAQIKWFADGDTPQSKLSLTVQAIWLAIIFGMLLKMLFFG